MDIFLYLWYHKYMKNFYFSIDVGGTLIKAGIVDEDGKILFSEVQETQKFTKSNTLSKQIFSMIETLAQKSNFKIESSKGIGIGLPGLIDSENGILKFSGNLNLKDYKLIKELKKLTNVPIKIANDADVATLAEQHYGAGLGFKNFIMVTVGTGVGGGIVIDGKALSSSRNYSGEIGHIKITENKIPCTCGEFGCFEALASTKALTEQTKLAMKKDKNSLMWSKYNLENVNGKTVFDFKDVDETAKQVFDNFISYLGNGIVSLVNIFVPELIVISGGISQQKNNLTKPLETYVNSHIYTRHINYKIKIKTAQQIENAGMLGARCLFKEEK